jgi:hypothetical protein
MTRKRSCVVREGAERKGPKGTSLAAYFMPWSRSLDSTRGSHDPPGSGGKRRAGGKGLQCSTSPAAYPTTL